MLNKAQLIAVGKRRIETVRIESLDGDVGIRAMTGAETDSYSEAITTKIKDVKGKETREFVFAGSRAKLVALCVCDEEGTPIMSADEWNAQPNKVLNELFEACQKVNGVKEADSADKDEAKND